MIISFYSFKGGVGRTMALVNIGIELARSGKKILMVDFDLEAPGLTTYMRDLSPISLTDRPGVIEWLEESVVAGGSRGVRWRDYVSRVETALDVHVDVMTSGVWDASYNSRVLGFDWDNYFEHGGGDALESLRDAWKAAYDLVLVDSRTGITDIAGVCTVHLPDIIAPVFAANEQSVAGVSDVIRRAQTARLALVHPRGRALIFPLASRFDDRTESELAHEWMQHFAEVLGEFYDDWLPTSVTPRQALERTKLPYVSYYSFGDKLAVLRDSPSDITSLGFAFRTAARLIEQDFRDVDGMFLGKQLAVDMDDDPVAAYDTLTSGAPERLATELQNVMARILFYALLKNGTPAGPPAESIDEDIQTMLIRAGIVVRRDDRLVLADRGRWANRSTPVHEYLEENSELLTWSHRATETVEARLEYVLEGEDLAQGVAHSLQSRDLLTPYELELVNTSQSWVAPRRPTFSWVLLSYALIFVCGLIGWAIGAIVDPALQADRTDIIGLALGSVVGGIAAMRAFIGFSRLRVTSASLPVVGISSALRVASLALQRYGYTGKRRGPVAILTVRDLNRLPVSYVRLPRLRPQGLPEILTVYIHVNEDSMHIRGPRFAVDRVAYALRKAHQRRY